MGYDDYFPKEFLNAEDLKQPKVLTIRHMGRELVGLDKKPKLVARFDEIDQGMVVNKTNADTLKYLLGPEPEDAIGGLIELYADRAMFNGKLVPAIRVRRPGRTQKMPLDSEQPRRAATPLVEPRDDGAPPHDAVPEGPDEGDLPE